MPSRFLAHLRHAARLLVRQPVFSATAVLSIGIGIGANTTIFTTANGLLLAPIPGVTAPAQLLDIGASRDGRGLDTVSYPTYVDVRRRATSLSGVYALDIEPRALSLAGASGATRIYGQLVSANYFDVLGVRPAFGDTFHDRDDVEGQPLRKVVVSHGFWRRHFGADPAVVGRAIRINGDPFVITGVATQGFQGTSVINPDVWVPLTARATAFPTDQLMRGRENTWLVMGGRLAPGVSLAAARAELAGLHDGLAHEFPDAYSRMNLVAAPLSRVPGMLGDLVIPFLAVLGAVVALVLLVACTNLAGLLLARAAGRTREMAVRLALGASRGDLIAQLLAESLLLFAAGAGAALLISRWMSAALWSLVPALPVPIDVSQAADWRVAAFTASVALVAALLTGLAPALQSRRANLTTGLKGDTSARGRQRLRHVLVSTQVGLSLILLVVAGLLLRALGAATHLDPGFRVDGVDVVSLDLAIGGYTSAQTSAVTERLRSGFAAIPGVAEVGAAAMIPLEGSGMGLGAVRRAGEARPEAIIDADWNVVSPQFFGALALPLVGGRGFGAADGASAPLVAIVNEQFARQAWPDRDPVGQRLEVGDFGRRGSTDGVVEKVLTVVGIARDAKYRWVGEEPRPFIYVPMSQQPWDSPRFFLARDRRLDPATDLSAAIRRLVSDVDPNLPVVRLIPLTDVARFGLLPQRIAAAVGGALGTLALVLAAIGTYGVTAFAVARRTREIGLRMALGADRRAIVRLVLGVGLRLTLIGGGIAIIAAMGAASVLRNTGLLLDVPAVDPVTFVGTAVILVSASLLASYVPARRAAGLNPIAALRIE